ncbi:uncharacterized protein TNCV_4182201 [Trichonephila clavipes]|nr:uncharacterized protein TNCV_4182201 [Trichonephila clavipes]
MPDIKIDDNGLFEEERRLNAYLNSDKLKPLEGKHAEIDKRWKQSTQQLETRPGCEETRGIHSYRSGVCSCKWGGASSGKPFPCLHNGNEVDDWMGLDEGNSWFKSQVRDSNRSQDIGNLNKFEKFKTIKYYGRNIALYEHEIIITGRAGREGSTEPGPNGLSGLGAEILAKKL